MDKVNDVEDRTTVQAMSKIVSVAAGSITVRDKIIPASMAGQNWEVRRPFYRTNGNYDGRANGGPCNVAQATNPNAVGLCYYEGYFNHQEANETAGRKFRITRKTVFRIP
jgi:hypothetical protein